MNLLLFPLGFFIVVSIVLAVLYAVEKTKKSARYKCSLNDQVCCEFSGKEIKMKDVPGQFVRE